MKRSWLIGLKEKLCSRSAKPWACLETSGPNAEGRVEFSISVNPAFLKNLRDLGMGGINDEETMQLFFLQSRMVPEHLDPDTVTPDEMPTLGTDGTHVARGNLRTL